MTVKLGLIGGGYWGKNLIREFNNVGILNVICDINEESLKKYNLEYPNIKTTTQWNDVLTNNEINSVCIALPAEMHYKFAKEALESNKDVYVEKPITLNINEAHELVEIAKNKNKILMVGHLLHYHPAIEKIKEIINSNQLGKVKNIVANRLNLGIFRTQENVLWSFAPHDISVILSLCENKLPNWVQCNGNDCLTKNVHDITNSILKFDNDNIYVNINVNWLNPYKEQKLSIVCEKGMILFDDMEKEGKLKLYKNYINWSDNLNPLPNANKVEPEIVKLDLSSSPLYKECLHFKECCENRKNPITTGEEGVRVLTVLNKLTESLNNNGSKIKIEQNIKKYYAHETAIIDEGAEIGEGTKIWHYSHICKGAKIGKNCNIGQNVFIAGDAVIGNNCKVQNNVSIYAGVKAGDYVFFGPSCVLTNDINPRGMYSKAGHYIDTILEDGVTLGANCTIVCGNTIGKHSLIGAGAVVCKNVDEYSIMVGNPAKKIGTIDEKGIRTLSN
jgi:UDP-2-acetamido-3-amino-2,3-dideoxy-glucuronate N-acetyltransferase